MLTPIYTLNQGQKEAAEEFFKILFDDNNVYFIVSGPAGVGKTYWMGYIIDHIMPRYHEACKLMGIDPDFDGVTMTATTNKAAEVLEGATNRPTQTIHSFLNLIVYEDYETGRSKIKKNPRTWVVHEKKIIFIDECSMIDSHLYRMLDEGTHKCKVIFVGDHNQLAPVMEQISPVYKQNTPMYKLTEQMRNSSQPALMAICEQLRQTVETGIFKPIHEVPGVIDYLDDTTMPVMLDQTFASQNKESRVLAYTNKRVIEFNDYIRQTRNLPDEFQVDEILVNNSALKAGNKKPLAVEAEVTITAKDGNTDIEIEKGVFLNVNHYSFTSHLGETYNNIPIPTDRNHYNDLVRHYSSKKNWERYFYLKQNFPDLRPRDAATVHKSQGSTYESVFIDLGNISTCRKPDQTARMLYVAFSRARQRVYVYGDLDPKYGGFIRA